MGIVSAGHIFTTSGMESTHMERVSRHRGSNAPMIYRGTVGGSWCSWFPLNRFEVFELGTLHRPIAPHRAQLTGPDLSHVVNKAWRSPDPATWFLMVSNCYTLF